MQHMDQPENHKGTWILVKRKKYKTPTASTTSFATKQSPSTLSTTKQAPTRPSAVKPASQPTPITASNNNTTPLTQGNTTKKHQANNQSKEEADKHRLAGYPRLQMKQVCLQEKRLQPTPELAPSQQTTNLEDDTLCHLVIEAQHQLTSVYKALQVRSRISSNKVNTVEMLEAIKQKIQFLQTKIQSGFDENPRLTLVPTLITMLQMMSADDTNRLYFFLPPPEGVLGLALSCCEIFNILSPFVNKDPKWL